MRFFPAPVMMGLVTFGATLFKMAMASNLTVAQPAAQHGIPPLCFIHGWGDAEMDRIEQGIDYLRGHAVCDSPAHSGQNGCTRVSCSYSSGIFVCNDNDYHVYPSCAEVIDMTNSIISWCTMVGPYSITQGQEFAFGDAQGNGKFNVVVRADNC